MGGGGEDACSFTVAKILIHQLLCFEGNLPKLILIHQLLCFEGNLAKQSSLREKCWRLAAEESCRLTDVVFGLLSPSYHSSGRYPSIIFIPQCLFSYKRFKQKQTLKTVKKNETKHKHGWKLNIDSAQKLTICREARISIGNDDDETLWKIGGLDTIF